jgi:hypothetical protein
MATTSFESEPRLAPTVQTVLDALRVRVRWYVWLEGLAGGLAWLGLAFWISLGIDWAFEPPRAVRAAVLAVIGVVLLGVIAQLILRRAFISMSNSNMATLLERRFSKLDDSLLTAVLLTAHHNDPEKCNPAMLARTCREAAERIGDLELLRVFDPVPLMRKAGAAVVLALSIVLFAALAPEALGVWARRTVNYPMSDEQWPRRTHLTIFVNGKEYRKDQQEPVSVVVGRKAEIRVVADPDFEVPRMVEIRHRVDGGSPSTAPLEQSGDEFKFTFARVDKPITFDVFGGDDRRYGLRIEVVQSPFVSSMTLDYAVPAYLKPPRQDQTDVAISGAMQVRAGTEVTIHASTNKPLRRVAIHRITAAGSELLSTLDFSKTEEAPEGFDYPLEALRVQTVLQFTLVDTDGIRSAKPFTLTLNVLADEVPQLGDVKLDGIGKYITPNAVVPLRGQVTDDNGLRGVWAEASVDEKGLPRLDLTEVTDSGERPLELGKPGDRLQRRGLGRARVEIEQWKLVPGQKLAFSIRAADFFDLHKKLEGFAREPDFGTTEVWHREVVTPEKLREELENEEFDLRRRFERVVQELSETRDLLTIMDFSPPDARKKPGDKVAGAEPDDKSREEAANPEELRLVRAGEALQYCRKNAEETRGVAEGFDGIRKQIINNQIDTEELKMRLEDQIATPLYEMVSGERKKKSKDDRREKTDLPTFPQLEETLKALQAATGDLKRGAQLRDDARAQTIELLAVMRQVLERMKELEDYNQAVELLRTIIKLQESLERVTKERHKQTIRDLKED